jgi:putative transposase
MSHAHVCVRIHYIFSTKDRQTSISIEMQPKLWGYIGATANNLGMKTFAVGGIEDHVHALVGLPPTMSVATAVQKLKANSSRWMATETGKRFAWQEGYSAFSVSLSQMEVTARYIRNQRAHHKKRSFSEELACLLKLHGLGG